MNASALQDGDVFVECSAEDWVLMTPSQRDKLRTRTAHSDTVPCTSERANVHVSTSAGRWCIPAAAPVVLV